MEEYKVPLELVIKWSYYIIGIILFDIIGMHAELT